MQVIVKTRHMKALTPALKEYAEEKLGTSITRYFDRPAAKIEIELDSEEHADKSNFSCRATVFMPGGRLVVIHESGENLYQAIDVARDRLANQVKRERERSSQRRASRRQVREMRHHPEAALQADL